MPKITSCLWFDTEGEDAANFYVSVFPNSRIVNVSRYGGRGPRPAGSVMTVDFELDGQPFMALNGGPEFTFNEAVSFVDRLRRPGRGRPLLDQAERGRRGRPVRLAQGPLRAVLAGRSRRPRRARQRSRPRQVSGRHQGDARHAQARRRRAAGGLRRRLNPRAASVRGLRLEVDQAPEADDASHRDGGRLLGIVAHGPAVAARRHRGVEAQLVGDGLDA